MKKERYNIISSQFHFHIQIYSAKLHILLRARLAYDLKL